MKPQPLLLCALLLPLAGCAHSGPHAPDAASRATGSNAASATARLERALRSALAANEQLSARVLWLNKLPAGAARSTAGPALAQLRASAAARRQTGLRVRLLSDRRQILSLTLDPSYLQARALILDHERLQRASLDGRPAGPVFALTERDRYQLHRPDHQLRFVVWQVTQP